MGVEQKFPKYTSNKISMGGTNCQASWQDAWYVPLLNIRKICLDGLKKHSGQGTCMVVWHGRVVGKANMFGMKNSMASLATMAFNSKMTNIIRLKREKKFVQFVNMFHLLKLGRPLINFESMHGLLLFLKVENNPNKHCTNTRVQGMVECMTNVVLATTKTTIQTTNNIFGSCDEVTNIDNHFLIFVHGYVVEDFKRTPILLNLEQVIDGCTT